MYKVMSYHITWVYIFVFNLLQIKAYLNYESARGGQELLLCRKCGSDVADSNYLINKTSPGAIKTDTKNLYGKKNVTVQTLINPFGIQFEIIALEKARCENIGSRQAADSWFPGHSWRICVCPRCGQHLGWTFEATSSLTEAADDHIHMFHGLIISNILGENFTDSLLMVPKTYKM